MDPSCIFCKIIAKTIPAKIVHEDEFCLAFEDLNPQAPTHTLIVPKKHIPDIQSMASADRELVGHLFFVAKTIATEKKLGGNGYRLVVNNGQEAGQSVFHIHLHLLSGRSFSWPPG